MVAVPGAAEPAAAIVARGGVIDLGKFLEQQPQFVLCNADAAVGYRKPRFRDQFLKSTGIAKARAELTVQAAFMGGPVGSTWSRFNPPVVYQLSMLIFALEPAFLLRPINFIAGIPQRQRSEKRHRRDAGARASFGNARSPEPVRPQRRHNQISGLCKAWHGEYCGLAHAILHPAFRQSPHE